MLLSLLLHKATPRAVLPLAISYRNLPCHTLFGKNFKIQNVPTASGVFGAHPCICSHGASFILPGGLDLDEHE